LDIHVYWNILTMHVPINVKSPNNISKWQMGFNSAFKGLMTSIILQKIHYCWEHTLLEALTDSKRIPWNAKRHSVGQEISRHLWKPTTYFPGFPQILPLWINSIINKFFDTINLNTSPHIRYCYSYSFKQTVFFPFYRPIYTYLHTNTHLEYAWSSQVT
jgi:hypothetical protein